MVTLSRIPQNLDDGAAERGVADACTKTFIITNNLKQDYVFIDKTCTLCAGKQIQVVFPRSCGAR